MFLTVALGFIDVLTVLAAHRADFFCHFMVAERQNCKFSWYV